MIDWTAFDWPSFSTLATGLAAVVGAVWIGRRQAGIAERQTDLLARQEAWQAISIKADLFDRRLATYEATADFLIHIADIGEDEEVQARTRNFAAKMRESQFLFQPEVYAALKEIWDVANDLRVSRVNSIARAKGELPRDAELGKRIQGHIEWMFTRLETLADVFKPDLELSGRSLLRVEHKNHRTD